MKYKYNSYIYFTGYKTKRRSRVGSDCQKIGTEENKIKKLIAKMSVGLHIYTHIYTL